MSQQMQKYNLIVIWHLKEVKNILGKITGLVIAITLHLEFWLAETSINHLIIEKHTEASSQVHVKGQSNNFAGCHRSSPSTEITTSR